MPYRFTENYVASQVITPNLANVNTFIDSVFNTFIQIMDSLGVTYPVYEYFKAHVSEFTSYIKQQASGYDTIGLYIRPSGSGSSMSSILVQVNIGNTSSPSVTISAAGARTSYDLDYYQFSPRLPNVADGKYFEIYNNTSGVYPPSSISTGTNYSQQYIGYRVIDFSVTNTVSIEATNAGITY